VRILEEAQQQDFRLSPPLADVCDSDIFRLCADACDIFSGRPCNGAVLSCLAENQASLHDSRCHHEVEFWLSAQVRLHTVLTWLGRSRVHAIRT
jgi:hypothetical protein